MGVSYKGWRKRLIIFLFTAPTMIGVTILSLYPMLYNVFISLTNRSRFHYKPPEDIWHCDPKTLQHYCWQQPLLGNYQEIFGPLVTKEALGAWLRLFIVIVPIIAVAWYVRRVKEKSLSPPPTWYWWLIGFAASGLLWFGVKANEAIALLSEASDFFIVMFHTFLYVLACIPFFFLFGLILALILNNRHIKAKGAWRTLLIFPWAVPSYITALIWQFFFRTEQGTINQVLRLFGIQGPAWLQDPLWAFVAVVVINIWLSYPFFMVVILGALQSIPQDQYEAAEVDGATWFQQLTSITLPLLKPAVMPAIVLSAITTFQMFNTVWLVTAGGPIRGAGKPGVTEFVMIYGYKTLFRGDRYADAGAYATVIFILLFFATLFSLRFTKITKGAYQ